MRKYRYFEHTADIGLVAYGSSLGEAFANAASGLTSIITDLRRIKESESRTIEIKEKDQQKLLFVWLNTIIYYFEVGRMLFKRCEVRHFDSTSLSADCYGEKYDPGRHELKMGVKSATYHMMKIDTVKNQVRVILDV